MTLRKYKMADILKTIKSWETAVIVELMLFNVDKMDAVTWNKDRRS